MRRDILVEVDHEGINCGQAMVDSETVLDSLKFLYYRADVRHDQRIRLLRLGCQREVGAGFLEQAPDEGYSS